MEITIKVDGAGPRQIGATKVGGFGAVLHDFKGYPMLVRSGHVVSPNMTNNYAEFLAIELGLEMAIDHDLGLTGRKYLILSDSQYAVSCWHNPELVKKPHLLAIKSRWFELAAKLNWKVNVRWISSEENKDADKASRDVLKEFFEKNKSADNNDGDMAF